MTANLLELRLIHLWKLDIKRAKSARARSENQARYPYDDSGSPPSSNLHGASSLQRTIGRTAQRTSMSDGGDITPTPNLVQTPSGMGHGAITNIRFTVPGPESEWMVVF